MSFLVLPQHEQFYPEGLSYEVLENLGWIKLAPKFKDFPAPTAIFKDFQGLELFISKFQGLSRCVRTLYMDKQALLEVKPAILLYCISKIPLCLWFGLQIQLVVSSFSAG